MKKKISIAVIKRLPRYYRYLRELMDAGVTRISSEELSEKMSLTASQIRQDLNNFGGFGQQGYGYNVEYLYNELKKILGLTSSYNVIIIGAGNIGQALVNYTDFEGMGFHIKAMFDVNPKIVGMSIRGIKVYDIDDLVDYIKNNRVDLAALTLPESGAKDIIGILTLNGVKAFWNFSHVDLSHLGDNIIVEHVHLSDSLMTLSYKLNEARV